MMKFFRKYNKALLAVFMAFLMIVFVADTAFTNLFQPDPAKQKVWTSNLGDIMAGEIQQAGLKLQLAPVMFPIEPTDLVLLSREARKFGFGSSADAIREINMRTEPNRQSVQKLSRDARVNTDTIFAARAELNTVTRVFGAMLNAAQPSEAEVRAAAREALDKVRIQAISLPARPAFEDAALTFTDAELEAHFQAYREKERGAGLNFGYVVPDSVKLQYAQIQRDPIVAALRKAVGEERNALGMDILRAARKYYDENRTTRSEFLRPITPPEPAADPAAPPAVIPPAETAPAEAVPPAAEPAKPDGGKSGAQAEAAPAQPVVPAPPVPAGETTPPTPAPQYLTWEEGKDIAVDWECRRRGDQIAQEIAAWFVKQAVEPWLDSERGEDRYRKTPAGVTDAEFYEKIVKGLPRQYHYPEAIKFGTTDFFAQVDAFSVPGLGAANNQGGQRFTNLPFNYQGLAVIGEKADATQYLALHETSRDPVRNMASGDMFVYRAVEVRKARPAESLAEVRAKVDKDLHLLKAYEAALARAQELESAARAGAALKDVFENDPIVKIMREDPTKRNYLQYGEPEPFTLIAAEQAGAAAPATPSPVYVGPAVGVLSGAAARQVFDLAKPGRNPLTIIEDKDYAKVLVVTFLEYIPGREDEYEQIRTQVASRISNERQMAVMQGWLDTDKIKARTGLQLVKP